MSALLEGFRTGFGAMNQHYQQEENKRRYDQQFERQGTIHDLQVESLGQRNTINQNNVDNIEQNNAYTSALQTQNLATGGMRNTQLNNQLQQYPADMEYQNEMRELNLGNGALNQQILQNNVDQIPQQNEYNNTIQQYQLDGAEMQNNQNKQQYMMNNLKMALSTQDPETIAYFIATNDLTGTNMAPLKTIEGIQSGVALGDALNNGDLQAAATSANSFFRPQLDKAVGQMGRNKSPITRVDIAGIRNEGEGFKIPVTVTTQNGEQYPSFISELRSGDANDPQKLFSPDQLIGTIKATHSVATLMQGSSYYQRLLQNAQNVNQASQPKVKPNYKEVTGAMGNTAGYFDPATKEWVPLPDTAQGGVLATTPEEVADNNTQLREQKKAQLVTGFGNQVMQQYGSAGLDQKESNMIAEKVINQVEQAKASGQKLDANAITQQEVESYLQVREKLQAQNIQQNKNVERGMDAWNNNPYQQR